MTHEQEELPEFVLSLNLASVHGQFAAALQRILDCYAVAAVGLSKRDEQSYSEFRPFFNVFPAECQRLTHEAAAQEADRWLLRSIVRDSIELTNALLENYKLLCALFKSASGAQLTGEAYNRITDTDAKRFHDFGLPQKLSTLRDEFGITSEFEPHVLSINRLRACVVHRLGVVTDKDLKGEPELKVFFRTAHLLAVSPDKQTERPLEFRGCVVESGWSVCMRFSDKVKSFKRGEQVSLSYQEVADTMFTLMAFSASFVQAVEAYGRSRGVPIQAKDADGGAVS